MNAIYASRSNVVFKTTATFNILLFIEKQNKKKAEQDSTNISRKLFDFGIERFDSSKKRQTNKLILFFQLSHKKTRETKLHG